MDSAPFGVDEGVDERGMGVRSSTPSSASVCQDRAMDAVVDDTEPLTYDCPRCATAVTEPY